MPGQRERQHAYLCSWRTVRRPAARLTTKRQDNPRFVRLTGEEAFWHAAWALGRIAAPEGVEALRRREAVEEDTWARGQAALALAR